MPRKPPNPYRAVSETDFQQQLIDALHLHGWSLVAHFRPQQNGSGKWSTAVAADGVGFPDLLAIHPGAGDVIAIEVKREGQHPTDEQQEWLDGFTAAGVDAVCWQPHDIDDALQRIARPQIALRVAVDFIARTSPKRGRRPTG